MSLLFDGALALLVQGRVLEIIWALESYRQTGPALCPETANAVQVMRHGQIAVHHE